jgi:hypothetical protein
VNHPASVNSDQPKSSSANFPLFTSSVPVRSSDISSEPSMNLKPNPRWRTAKKIMSSSYKKFVNTTQKKKSKTDRPLNAKPVGLRRMFFLVLQKDGREGFAGIQLRLTLHQFRTLN